METRLQTGNQSVPPPEAAEHEPRETERVTKGLARVIASSGIRNRAFRARLMFVTRLDEIGNPECDRDRVWPRYGFSRGRKRRELSSVRSIAVQFVINHSLRINTSALAFETFDSAKLALRAHVVIPARARARARIDVPDDSSPARPSSLRDSP